MAKRKKSRIKKICSKCDLPLEPNRLGRYRYCRSCHAEFMRLTRPKYSELSPEQKLRANARAILRVYIKRGSIQKQPCVNCNAFDSQAHHEDYSKPLEVVWLCRRHHLQAHGHKPK